MEVLPWLFLGNAYHAARTDRLTSLGISALLNVAEQSPRVTGLAPASADVEADQLALMTSFCHVNLPIADSATSDISSSFPQAIDFIGNYSRVTYCRPRDLVSFCSTSYMWH